MVNLSTEQQAMIDTVLAGRDVVVDATVGSGKALTNDSRVPTPLGWRLVGDIRVGDELYTRFGVPTKVVGVFPQGLQDVYEVTLFDGRRILCSGDHNWWARKTTRRVRKFEIFTTAEMMEAGTMRNAGVFKATRFRIPAHSAIELPVQGHRLHPYVIGALLGNGCLTERWLTMSSAIEEIPQRVAELLGFTVRRRSLKNYSWDFFDENGHRIKTTAFLGDLAPDMGCLSGSKSIPAEYLVGTIEQRLQLVQGLMDTDGSVSRGDNRYSVSFSTTSTALVHGLKDVLGSLGYVSNIIEDARVEKYTSGACYHLGINIANADKAELFAIGPKKAIAVEAAQHVKQRDYAEVGILSIRKLDRVAEMTCFQVEDEEHLFLADDYVVTHNTTAIQALCDLVGPTRKVLYLTYNRLLKLEAKRRVKSAEATNYHGFVYPHLVAAGISAGVGESIAAFNQNFLRISASGSLKAYDLLVVDEYQDITEEFAELLVNLKSLNPAMQVVMVGDVQQKVKANTTLDVEAFVAEFCVDPVRLRFTQSFRIGPELAGLLGEAWGKKIVGANLDQQVRVVEFQEALAVMQSCEPGDLLCLGKRNGGAAYALNQLEDRMPGRFNKHTVYASIKDGDDAVPYGDDVAVFTTFDSSKGLERRVSVVFDYDEAMWKQRLGIPNTDPEIMRNIFLVAASRGKGEVLFVRGQFSHLATDARNPKKRIGYVPVSSFTDLAPAERAVYRQPFWASDAFDFKYLEDVERCYRLLDLTRLDTGDGAVIEIERTDGLMDLSPAVGSYQEALFFDGYRARDSIKMNPSPFAQSMLSQLSGDTWRDSLVVTAAGTSQRRYVDQVARVIPVEATSALMLRLQSQLPRDACSQVPLLMEGRAKVTKGKRSAGTPIAFSGIADALHDGRLFELKFVTELSHAMFLQLALYLVMARVEEGVLWNTRTDERWLVRVPDEQAFMDAVVVAATKQDYAAFARTM